MLGAIYGDKAGSLYELEQRKEIKPVNPKELILPNSFYSDDTIETIAIMDSIMNRKDYKAILKSYILKYQTYKPDMSLSNCFSQTEIDWAVGRHVSKNDRNEAMMRISPVGYMYNSEEYVIVEANYATRISHNTEEALFSSILIALMIYYFRCGLSKDEVYSKIYNEFKIKAEYKPFEKFNETCRETLKNCLYALYISNSFEDAIRQALLMGGKTSTNACIVGSLAEAMYGMSDEEKNQAEEGLPQEFKMVLNRYYK